jgi:hypothetical protein
MIDKKKIIQQQGLVSGGAVGIGGVAFGNISKESTATHNDSKSGGKQSAAGKDTQSKKRQSYMGSTGGNFMKSAKNGGAANKTEHAYIFQKKK